MVSCLGTFNLSLANSQAPASLFRNQSSVLSWHTVQRAPRLLFPSPPLTGVVRVETGDKWGAESTDNDIPFGYSPGRVLFVFLVLISRLLLMVCERFAYHQFK